jgi:murein endopeptidase
VVSTWALAATGLSVACALALTAGLARAVPPGRPNAAVRGALPEAQWVRHSVIPGERLVEIAERYGVRARDVSRWNHLAPNEILSIGERLRIWTQLDVPPRERIVHTVARGESWSAIAQRYDVDTDRLRRHWNPGARTLREGQELALWVERRDPGATDLDRIATEMRDRPATATEATAPQADGPIIPVPPTAVAVGLPDRGRLANGIQLPANDALYSIRNPAHSWATSHTIMQLQQAVADFRETSGFRRDLLITDISRQGGGRFVPHRSHRTGRDVDIQLPLAVGVSHGKVPWRADEVDWSVTWRLVEALLRTGEVRYIFLSRTRQRLLRDAALRSGATRDEIDRLIQYPRRAQTGVVRHSRGHVKHIHVRFRCASHEMACREI